MNCYTQHKRSWVGGGGSYFHFSLSVCLNVSAPSVDMILSMRVVTNGRMVFSEIFYTNNLPSEDAHLEFS